ncbi:metal-binding protein [Halomonas campaniensis]|nr:metal-binding protein [Halomonas campaniensis]
MSKNCLTKRLVASFFAAYSLNALAAPTVDVHSDPNCGCCSDWVSHLEEAGFEVNHQRDGDLRSIKMANGVPPELASCHTAIVEGYVIEGHVPASDIQRLLEEQPEVVGLTVPGMPHGSPGMETGRVDDYAVLSWTRNDSTPTIFSEYTQ